MNMKELGESVGVNVPKSYQIIGDIILIKLLESAHRKRLEELSKKIMGALPRIKTVCFVRGVEGELRTPKIIASFGDGTETVHREHGILYKLDVARVMFSKGNLNERKRIISQVRDGEKVVDMFAGIGYFSLGVAKGNPSSTVYAVEKNPESCKYLIENIRMNKLNNVIPVCDDNRNVRIENADRIIMGYFPHTERFIPYAKMMIKNGGVIHFHNSYKESELWNAPLKDVSGFGKIEVLNKKIVKSIAPRTYHVVLDVRVWTQ